MEIEREKLVSMYRRMLEIRRFEETVAELYKQGLIPGIAHLYIGEEAVAVGVCASLQKDDYIVGTHRGHGHSIAKGMDPKILMAELFGKATGCCGGIGGSMHSTDLKHGVLFSTAIVGGGIPIAVGAGLSTKMRNSSQVVACFFGDGAVNTGSFHEALNLASIWELPVIFVCENNMYAISTHVKIATSVKNIADRAVAYNMPGVIVDGNDVQAVHEVAVKAVERARKGEGPTLIECKTYRWLGHHVRDTRVEYRPKEEIERWKKRCPVEAFKQKLLKAGILTEKDVDSIQHEIEAKIEEAVKFAKESPYPSFEGVSEFVYA